MGCVLGRWVDGEISQSWDRFREPERVKSAEQDSCGHHSGETGSSLRPDCQSRRCIFRWQIRAITVFNKLKKSEKSLVICLKISKYIKKLKEFTRKKIPDFKMGKGI